jgi:peptidoglycan/xylan/chitin deacetylase (PgdA/CDA1 family)
MSRIVLHEFAVPRADALPPIVARVAGDPATLREAAGGLPDGAATPEAIAARVRRGGGSLVWGEPERIADTGALLRFCHERGASSMAIIRADPSLLPDLQVGSFFTARLRMRVARRAVCGLPIDLLGAPLLARLSSMIAADIAFWRGVRTAATAHEWERLTRSSYVVLYYHRIAGDRKPGQERYDVAPEVFERHMRWLRRLRLRPLTADELLAFHNDPKGTLPGRSFVLAADDGFRDAVVALARHADLRPYIFVNTSTVGGHATWADEEVASWSELRYLVERGGEVASHSQTHVSLPDLGPEALAAELEQSLNELRSEVPQAAPMLAYPHGRNDAAVRAAAAAAGYHVAFTSTTGRNGAGTDPYLLRRVDLKDWDGAPAVAWKVLTGQLVPYRVERWRLWVRARRMGSN